MCHGFPPLLHSLLALMVYVQLLQSLLLHVAEVTEAVPRSLRVMFGGLNVVVTRVYTRHISAYPRQRLGEYPGPAATSMILTPCSGLSVSAMAGSATPVSMRPSLTRGTRRRFMEWRGLHTPRGFHQSEDIAENLSTSA